MVFDHDNLKSFHLLKLKIIRYDEIKFNSEQ